MLALDAQRRLLDCDSKIIRNRIEQKVNLFGGEAVNSAGNSAGERLS